VLRSTHTLYRFSASRTPKQKLRDFVIRCLHSNAKFSEQRSSTNPGCKGITGTNAFTLPAPGVFGNSGRNTLRGPGIQDLDVSLSRTITFAERYKLQFRAESFNLTNTVAFGLPNSNVSGGSPGVITSLAGDPRIMQFAGRFSF
jgi:hypothetical protein